jgi:hypothetical protein
MSGSSGELNSNGLKRPVAVSSSSSMDTLAFASGIKFDGFTRASVAHVEKDTGRRQTPLSSSPACATIPSPALASQQLPVGRQLPEFRPATHNPIMQSAILTGNVMFPGTSLPGNSVPEFLYQLMKMLTDDNRDIIEWSNGAFLSALRGTKEAFSFVNALTHSSPTYTYRFN